MAGAGRVLRFAAVGALGFVVDAGVLQALVSLAGWGALAGRAVSVPVAVLATWWLNRRFTFAHGGGAGAAWASLVRYAGVSAGGAALNITVYSLLVLASPWLAARPVLPLAVASGLAMAFNYVGSKRFAFRRG